MAHAAATGDLRNNLEKLRSELRSTCVQDEDVDLEAIARGEPVGFLPLLHKVLLDNSLLVARYLSERGYQLYHINDRPFLEGVFRVVRNEFSYRPSLTLDQFLSAGYAERKIIFVCDVVKLCRRKADELLRLQKSAGKARTPPDAALKEHLSTLTNGRNAASARPDGHASANAAGTASSDPSEARRRDGGDDDTGALDDPNLASAAAAGRRAAAPVMATSQPGHNLAPRDGRTIPHQQGAELEASAQAHASGPANGVSGANRTASGSHLPIHPSQMNGAKEAASGGSWRSKRTLTLQTGGDGGGPHANGHGPEELKSPTSSGPVSPVSITSAASAPAVFRQAPIRVKPDMISHLHPHQHQPQYQHHPSHNQHQAMAAAAAASSSSGAGTPATGGIQEGLGDAASAQAHPHLHSGTPPFLNVNNTARAMECWVTSPPQLMDRSKRKEALAVHLNKPHTSPRIHHGSRGSSPSSMHRANSVGSLSAGSKRGVAVTGSVAAAAAMMQRPKSGQSSPVSASKVPSMSTAFATRARTTSSQGSASPRQRGAMALAARSGRSFSPAKDRSAGNIARKLKLPSGTSTGSNVSLISTPSSQQTGAARPESARSADATASTGPAASRLRVFDTSLASTPTGSSSATTAASTGASAARRQLHAQDEYQASEGGSAAQRQHLDQQSGERQLTYVSQTAAPSAGAQASAPDLTVLVSQMNKIAMAFESVAHIPERFDAMEKRINSALESMDKRITEIDSRVRQQVEDTSSNGASSTASASSQPLGVHNPRQQQQRQQQRQQQQQQQQQQRQHRLAASSSSHATIAIGHGSEPAFAPSTARGSRGSDSRASSASGRGSSTTSSASTATRATLGSRGPAARTSAARNGATRVSQSSAPRVGSSPPSATSLVRATEGIDDFIKVIEERFRETETVLAESEN